MTAALLCRMAADREAIDLSAAAPADLAAIALHPVHPDPFASAVQ